MKTYINKLSFLLLSLLLVLSSCEKEDNLTIITPEPSFTLETPGISSVFLNYGLTDNPAFTIVWKDDLSGSASYDVEMSTDIEFTTPIALGNSTTNSFSMTVGELNTTIKNTGVTSFKDIAIYLRIKSGAFTSNNIQLLVTAYPINPPVITDPTAGSSYTLLASKQGETAITVNWTDGVLESTLGVDVTYSLEIAEESTSFATPVSIKNEKNVASLSLNHKEFNNAVLSINLVPDVTKNIDLRVKSTMTNASGDVLERISDVISVSITAFGITIPDNLFMVGTHNGWNNADATQQFRNHGDGVFSKVQIFAAGNDFKLLPTSGSWDGDWGEDKNNAGKIVQDDEQNIKVTDAGTYLVTIDYNTLSYTLANITTLFAVGDHNGWNNADASQEFNTSGNGVFTKVITFNAGDSFKLLPNSGSWDGDWGEDKNNAGKIVQDDEQNIKVTDAGTYVVTIDYSTLSFNIKELPTNLFVVGTPNSWNNATAPAFTKISEGLFEISMTLTSTDEFKFLPVQGSWDNDWGESQVHSGMLVRDDENNVKSPGDGTYKITVDFNKGTVTIL
jgi:hypothetical protein